MDLFVYGLLAGLIIGWSLCRLFLYDAEPLAPGAAARSIDAAAGTPAPDLRAASAHGFSLKGSDDLQAIEGIGPKIDELLKQAGVRSFDDLAAAGVDRVRDILAAAGPGFKLAQPDSWITQAQLAATGDWAALRRLQDQLVGGIDRSAAS